tara:strand:- start:1302 stop:2369 length:1068 start_codon:yes stop_codon:yes gene_type:complete
MQLLRDNLDNGIRDTACNTCWRLEDNGVKSFRESQNDPYHNGILKEVQDGILNTKLVAIDITTSNECNLACRMCYPGNSNLWFKDIKTLKDNDIGVEHIEETLKIGLQFENTKDRYIHEDSVQWQWLMNNTDKIKVIECSGGEPLYDTKFIKLLKKYVSDGNAGQTILNLHTNATQFNNPKMVDTLKEFKLQWHAFSIDGVGKVWEYIRYPGKWKDLTDSLDAYFSMKNIYIPRMTTVLTALNVFDIDNLKKFNDTLHYRYNKEAPPAELNFQEVYPMDKGTALIHLPKYLLEEALLQTGITDQARGLIQMGIDNNKENHQKVLAEIEMLDFTRNQNYRNFLDKRIVNWLEGNVL